MRWSIPRASCTRSLPAIPIATVRRVGSDWYLLRQRLCIKKYPTCYFMHRSFDATVKLLAGRNLGPDDIAEIEVTMGRSQTAVLVNERPRTGPEAKFSEQVAMAAAVILGRMGVNEVNDETVQRADFQSFFPRCASIRSTSTRRAIPRIRLRSAS